MKTFHCAKCDQQVFFENTWCEQCGGMLGYLPGRRTISTFEMTDDGLWRSVDPAVADRLYRQCANYAEHGVCNWMIDADVAGDLCASCNLTRVIPALSSEKNLVYWKRVETAKRRLLYSLWELNIQPPSKIEDPESGLAFEFLEEIAPGERVLTGHFNGLVTLNIAEADPANRERTREQMDEPYRTLLGHLRHESGHYYFDRLVAGSIWHERFRKLFGDDRADYAQSLKTHYESGPAPGWEQLYVSAYASSHPMEDWAETWAHYLHMIDTLETAHSCGMSLKPRRPAEPKMQIDAPPMNNASFNNMLDNWFALTYVLNSLNRSVGQPDAYPFTLSAPVTEKLRFVHELVIAQSVTARNGKTPSKESGSRKAQPARPR
ncbi:putative zinc-binding metallopeptidase [soil metagenome]